MKLESEASTGPVTVVVMAMAMAYSVILLRLGLPVTTVAWLTSALAGVSAVIGTILGRRSPVRLPRAARRMLRAVVTERDENER